MKVSPVSGAVRSFAANANRSAGGAKNRIAQVALARAQRVKRVFVEDA
jgi:hypothetical protein